MTQVGVRYTMNAKQIIRLILYVETILIDMQN
jgi:hypothetical protein